MKKPSGTDRDERRRRVLDWLREHGGRATARDLWKAGLFRDKSQADGCLRSMIEAGLGRWLQRIGVRGRPTRLFVALPDRKHDQGPTGPAEPTRENAPKNTPENAGTPENHGEGGADINDAVVERLIIALVRGAGEGELPAVARQLGVPESKISKTTALARRRLTRAAEFSRDEEFAKAKKQLEAIYRAAITDNPAAALNARRELNKLLDLHRRPVEMGQTGETEEAKRAREHLAWLLPPKPTPPLSELARVATLEIMRLASAAGVTDVKRHIQDGATAEHGKPENQT